MMPIMACRHFVARRWRSCAATLGLLLAGPTGLNAQETRGPDTSCRLHVWPSAGLKVQRQFGSEYAFTGLSKADLESTSNDGALSTLAANPNLPLSPTAQLRLLTGSSVDQALALAGHALVGHEQPLTSTVLRTTKTRYAQDDATGCYVELVVNDAVLSAEYARGVHLRLFLRFRQFGPDAAPVRSFATWVQSKLPIDRKTDPNSDQAIAVLERAFLDSITSFGGLLNKQAAAK